jgi:hypothetical protein
MRTFIRIVLIIVGSAMVLVGITVGSATWWVQQQLTVNEGRWVLQTPEEIIPADGCSTVIIELSGVDVDPGDIDQFEVISSRSQTVFTVAATGESDDGWLVGSTASAPVEDRLLGTRYCIAENSGGDAWTVNLIQVEQGSPDLSVAGLQGRWANADDGEKVVLPVPSAGESVVVAGGEGSDIGSIVLMGEYRIAGGSTLAIIGLVGGVLTVALGTVLLVISFWGLRQRGRHEARSSS